MADTDESKGCILYGCSRLTEDFEVDDVVSTLFDTFGRPE